MPVRVNFEIGHKATLRKKRTVDGLTHDWEVFVKGWNSTDIQHFVKKVVFHLHETFLNPRRVVTKPPYKVSESGYGGFVVKIVIYLRNSDKPKKITFAHNLILQTKPIFNVQKKNYKFDNPNEEFEEQLLKGGGQYIKSKPKSPKFKKNLKILPKVLDDSSEASTSTNDKSSIEIPANVEQKQTETTPNLEEPELKKRKLEKKVSQPNVEETAPNLQQEENTEDISPEYMSLLQDLYRKIMTLSSNDLQLVALLILVSERFQAAETQMDFNLSELDRVSVRLLQEVLLPSHSTDY